MRLLELQFELHLLPGSFLLQFLLKAGRFPCHQVNRLEYCSTLRCRCGCLQNPKKFTRCCASLFVAGNIRCSNSSFTLEGMSWPATSQWTSKNFIEVVGPCSYIGFIFHLLKLMCQGLQPTNQLLLVLPDQHYVTNILDLCDVPLFELFYDRVWRVNTALGWNYKWILLSIPCQCELFLVLFFFFFLLILFSGGYGKEYNHQIHVCVLPSWGLADLLWRQCPAPHSNCSGATTWLSLQKSIIIVQDPYGFRGIWLVN